jgi:hypothetical protein
MAKHRALLMLAATGLLAGCSEIYDSTDASATFDAGYDANGVQGTGGNDDLAVTTFAFDLGTNDLEGDTTFALHVRTGNTTTWDGRRVSVWVGTSSTNDEITRFSVTLGLGDDVIPNILAHGESIVTRVLFDADGDGYCGNNDSFWEYANNVTGDVTISVPGTNAARSACHPFPIRSDINDSACVDSADLSIVQMNQGMTNATRAQGDTNGDGVVDFTDLNNVAQDTGLGCL